MSAYYCLRGYKWKMQQTRKAYHQQPENPSKPSRLFQASLGMASVGEFKGVSAVHVPTYPVCTDVCEVFNISVGQHKSIGKPWLAG